MTTYSYSTFIERTPTTKYETYSPASAAAAAAGDNATAIANSLGKGGQTFRGPFGESMSRNITSHQEKGIGAWSDAEIKRAITQGIRKDGSRLKPPMGFAWYARMTDGDLDAVVAYLRTLPPKE
jgi:hypothetical protein